MSGILQEILRSKRAELETLRQQRFTFPFTPRRVDLKRTAGAPLKLITEIKFRSPSAGALSTQLDAGARAAAYAAAGAAMISVLCDGPFFGGSYDDLRAARGSCDAPLLCKEFILEECQLDAALAHGADYVLLIARCLTPTLAAELVRAAAARGLGVLFEIRDLAEVSVAVHAQASVVGVNARDLDTLVVDVAGAERILGALDPAVAAVHLSGLKQPEDVRRLRASRADAALVGETLMRQDDPGPLLRSLVAAAHGAPPAE